MKQPLRFLCLASALMVRLPAQANAPAPETRQLDFWLGDWKVFLATGQKDGDNRIEKQLAGFALLENWTGLDGHEGKSWFFYYRPEKRWKQVWVTDGGGVKEKAQMDGAPAGSMRFRGTLKVRDGRPLLDQTTLTPLPDGRVRQLIEQSADEGQTWRTVYDAYYVRKARTP